MKPLLLFLVTAGPIFIHGSSAGKGHPVPSVPPASRTEASPDTLRGIREATRILRHRYRGAGGSASARGSLMSGTQDRYCSWDEGSVCHGGDPDLGDCNANVPCHPDEEWFLEGLLQEALSYPTSGFLLGQAVFALTKFGRFREAQEAVDACRAQGWWCRTLRAYILYFHAPMTEVEAQYREAMAEAPPDVRCRWEDALWLLGEWDQRVGGMKDIPEGRKATKGWSCSARLAVSDTLWWWADPLFSEEGNDRWTTHVARATAAHLSEELHRAVRGADYSEEVREREWAMRTRRGVWDSYERIPGRDGIRLWTSEEAARYHFVPEVQPGHLSDPTWRIQGDIRSEGYTPDYGPVFAMGAQIARFRLGESLRIVAAADLEGSRLRRALDATSYFFLSDGPGSIRLRLHGETRKDVPVLLGSAPPLRYVSSLEVLTDLGIGVNRQTLVPLEMDGPEISDLLLYDPPSGLEPDSLEDVLPFMLGAASFPKGGRLGVLWEMYGAPEGEPITFELTMEQESGGLVERIVGLFPGGAQEGRSRVTWTEPSSGPRLPLVISLSLSDLSPGEYTLVLTAGWPGQSLLERRRRLQIS